MIQRSGGHDIARKLGVPYDDFVAVVKKNKSLQIILEKCREETDYEVENALLLILVTLLGIVTVVKLEEYWNNPAFIVLSPFGSTILCKLLQR